ncbi:MAG: acetyl-CoA carboxylase biotin carboxyl carrier protein [Candidatus Aminicenantes bacterium]|nr:acetyl-CoA carboxylase biotin carboxyl carrier protein [Candidatus Aminicenantes bacterium]
MNSKIDYKEINKLIKFMKDKNLSHFELEVEGLKIKIGRSSGPNSAPEPTPSSQPSPESEDEENSLSPEDTLQEGENNLRYIISPMVGTFFRAPDPSSSPFVEIGDPVKKNQILCIIEAMKLMNEIESEVDGIIKKVYIENGKPVEYGQRLFAIQLLP